MERLRERLDVARQALATLDEALSVVHPSLLERDGTIQRFEYTFETFWKLCQRYLSAQEGIQAASPKACMRGLGEIGLLDGHETTEALAMVDDRNDTVHVYRNEVAAAIHARIPGHTALMSGVIAAIVERIGAPADPR